MNSYKVQAKPRGDAHWLTFAEFRFLPDAEEFLVRKRQSADLWRAAEWRIQ